MKFDEKTAQELAKSIVLHCFRNSLLEELHSGVVPYSEKGDYSDVHIVTPVDTIPWNDASKICDEKMKALLVDVVNRTYSFLMQMHDENFLDNFLKSSMPFTQKWDMPNHIVPKRTE